ncbi:MAG: hypothetical protein C0170_05940, partial [Hydrogenobaculum sp.]
MKKINIGELIAGFSVSLITFTGITAIYHFSNGAVFSNTSTTATPVISSPPPASTTPITIWGGPLGEVGGSSNPGASGSNPCPGFSSTTLIYDNTPHSSSTKYNLQHILSSCSSATIVVTVAGGQGGNSSSYSGGLGGSTTLETSLSSFIQEFGNNPTFFYVVGGAGGNDGYAGGGG